MALLQKLKLFGRFYLHVTRFTPKSYLINYRQYHGRDISYYDVLGVKQYADIKEIKLAYFKMARKFHPDFNKTLDAKQMFELIAEAYDVLSDEKKKREYDETGHVSERFGGRTAQGPARQSHDRTYTAEQMYSKIFNTSDEINTFDEEAHSDFAVNFSGNDVTKEYIVSLTMEESITGITTYMHVVVSGVCNKCMGSRSEMGFQSNICPYCEGTGEETIKTGHIVGRRDCSYCNGEKFFMKFKCHECAGIGRILYDVPYYFDIPPGIEHGQVMKVVLDPKKLPKEAFEGVPRERSVFVTIKVHNSNLMDRQGMDLLSNIRLSPAIAVLGGKIDYAGLTAERNLEIKACTSSHTTLVLDGAGVHSQLYKGDHILTAVIKVPKKLNWWQLRKFKRFAVLDTDFTGTINGISSQLEHRFSLNLVNPTKISNTEVRKCLFNEEKTTFTEKMLKKYEELRNQVLRHMYPNLYDQKTQENKPKGAFG